MVTEGILGISWPHHEMCATGHVNVYKKLVFKEVPPIYFEYGNIDEIQIFYL